MAKTSSSSKRAASKSKTAPSKKKVSKASSKTTKAATKRPAAKTKSNRKVAAKKTTVAKRSPVSRPRKQQPALLSGSEVMLNLHNEHKYISKLLDLFSEELQEYNLHSLPDYNILYEIVNYLHTVADRTHHPRENIIFKKLSELDEDYRRESESQIMKHESLEQKTASLLDSLKILTKDKKSESVENFQYRCEEFLKAQRAHLDVEESKIFPRIVEIFSDDDWQEILPDIQPKHDPVFGEKVERPYRELYRHLSERMERAAEEFTLAEFIGLNTFTETVGAISTSSSNIVSIFRNHGRKAVQHDMVAFRRLWRSRSRKPQDYLSVSVDCMLNNFDTWAECMREMGTILRQTRTQIAEPYHSRIRLYHDIQQDNHQEVPALKKQAS